MIDTGWDADAATTTDLGEAMNTGKTCLTEDSAALIATPGLDVVIDATGSPAAGIRHALLAAENGCHMVMVNVEADVLGRRLPRAGIRQGGSGLFDGLW
ncbi:hypothetical protein [Ponticoccus litoralis]|uniref:Aspartate/homoserine dehydrogenase NAD-binding domain-containing protein n=1 Tax=Ponticoccus litoralis TaxID=422297 RepID=A0AAW9SB07_9RHOB